MRRIGITIGLACLLTGLSALASQSPTCDLRRLPKTQESGPELLDRASQLLAGGQACAAAIALAQANEVDPLDFVKDNGLFTLIRLEVEMGKYDDALDAYQSWPWEFEIGQQFDPWSFVAADQEAAARVLVFQLFAKFIPYDARRCLPNPLTHRCDTGQGLLEYGDAFDRTFPGNPFSSQMQEATTRFYRYRLDREMSVLNYYIRAMDRARTEPQRDTVRRAIQAQAVAVRAFARPADLAAVDRLVFAALVQKVR